MNDFDDLDRIRVQIQCGDLSGSSVDDTEYFEYVIDALSKVLEGIRLEGYRGEGPVTITITVPAIYRPNGEE